MHLILGTAQLGLNYGITNTNLKPSLSQALSILNKAYNNKIYMFDTAQAYGDSESKLGIFNQNKSNTTIITKIHIVDNISIKSFVSKSIANLQCKSLDVLLLHDYTYLNNKMVIENLLKLQQQNLIQNLGVSVYNVEEAIDSLSKPYIKYLQIPVNFLDQQWNNTTFQDLIKKRNDVFIYVRSIFLQGILVNDIIKWPKITNIDNQIYFDKITKLVEKYQLKNKVNLCVSYIKSLNWINGVVFGVDNEIQLIENIALFKSSRTLNTKELNHIQNIFKSVPVELTNPKFWKKNIKTIIN